MRGWAVFLLSAMSLFPLGHASPPEQTSPHSNLDSALVKPNSKEHESWRAVHHWRSDFSPSLASVHLVSSLDWASGLILIKAADPEASAIEVDVTHFTDKEVDLKDDVFKIEVQPDADLITSVMLREPYETPSNKFWIEIVLRLPRGRRYEIIESSTYSNTAEWIHQVENLNKFGITLGNLAVSSSNGPIYLHENTATEMNIVCDHGDISISGSVKTDRGKLYLRAYKGQIHIDTRHYDIDDGLVVTELFESTAQPRGFFYWWFLCPLKRFLPYPLAELLLKVFPFDGPPCEPHDGYCTFDLPDDHFAKFDHTEFHGCDKACPSERQLEEGKVGNKDLLT